MMADNQPHRVHGDDEHDIIICGGTVIDGSGGPAFRADVGIRGGRISAIGDLAGEKSIRRVDAQQRIVAPGFIDSHCHSDLSLLVKPDAQSKSRQGVTTEIIGNCGWSAFPVNPTTVDLYKKTSKPIFGDPDVAWEWHGLAEYFGKIEHQGTAVNVATLVGHGDLGRDFRLPPAHSCRYFLLCKPGSIMLCRAAIV